MCVRLQEVNAAPVRFIADMLQEDSWSHAFMDTLAPRGFVKVRREQRWCLQAVMEPVGISAMFISNFSISLYNISMIR